MRFIACGASVIGPRHLELDEPNQDAMGLSGCGGGWLISIADGLGSKTRSDYGSRCACLVSRRILRSIPNSAAFSDVLRSIHQHWLMAIEPIMVNDAATTLLFAKVGPDGKVRAAQLGDGLLLMRCGGQFKRISPSRVGFGNQTLALGKAHKINDWLMIEDQFTQSGDGIVLMSDGVSDDLEPDNLHDFFYVLYTNIKKRNRRRGRAWIRSELEDWPTPMHSDDKTLVAVFRIAE